MLEAILSWFNVTINQFLDIAGQSPFLAMWFLFLHGGWIVYLCVLGWGASMLWLDYMQTKFAMKREWVLLRIRVPRVSEQTPKATENLFANLAGIHSSISWTDKWIRGATQTPVIFELASIDGEIYYYMQAERRFRDMLEASVYAQYPDADIDEVEDYSLNVAGRYPDEEWDLWGTEMIPVKPDPYPLKTYHDFIDNVSGEFKDPLATMLEHFSRLGPGEQAWYQIVMIPSDQKDFSARAEAVINKLRGTEPKPKHSILDDIIEFPITVTQAMAAGLLGGGGAHETKKEESNFPTVMRLSPGQQNVLKAVEMKASKIGFMCKIRFIYVAKKDVKKNAKAVQPFIGSIKQMNTFDMQALKPDLKRVGMGSALWWFKERRNDGRKTRLMLAYRARSTWTGMMPYFLSAEELATLWHFPILMQVKAPSLQRTEAKKSEPPANIPFG